MDIFPHKKMGNSALQPVISIN